METLDEFGYDQHPEGEPFIAYYDWLSCYARGQAWLFAQQYLEKQSSERKIQNKINRVLRTALKKANYDWRHKAKFEQEINDEEFILRKTSKINRQGLRKK